MDASMGGSVVPCPPPGKKSTFFLMGGLFFMWGPFCHFCYLFSICMREGLFGLAPPPPYENFCGRPCSGEVRNFCCGMLSWHYGHISYRYRARGGGGVPE